MVKKKKKTATFIENMFRVDQIHASKEQKYDDQKSDTITILGGGEKRYTHKSGF